ncbi:MAG: bifunctional glutamate N-acetyltransferase/amino-acid acetyltransferase ArgJ [Desulfatitalea sp.]|nr:bifunctional glutamate N-acetyltransferase/amino-acid acetyltransferase ArgJ [Desulfatitalea sp.]NNK02098.1 bifunctional glutamate N-acetyltransferase/amino-acid acetyltransferase ArgJ [Desulfatitalea sp.]
MDQPLQCPGFQAAGLAAGIKKNGNPDLGLIYSPAPAALAGMFTRNRVAAAPVQLCRSRLAQGVARAIIVNAGNANCCTGEKGLSDATTICADVSTHLGLAENEVLPASTGVIGEPLPLDRIRAAIPGLVAALSDEGFENAARAMMTTDTVPKQVLRQFEIDGRIVTILAVAKGAGMIRPDMATMLCFICTDAALAADTLQGVLARTVDRTLNRITIDGDTSTNDTVLALANGVSGVKVQSAAQVQAFAQAMNDILLEVARRLVADGEGVTRVVDIIVKGAPSDADAQRIAEAVAHSPLVKTAIFGQDANWGRIMMAVGRAGVAIDPEAVDIYFNEVIMARSGQGCGKAAEAQVTAVMRLPAYTVTIDLNAGSGRWTMITCDFSIDYVKINADYRS